MQLSVSTYALPVMRFNDRVVRLVYGTTDEILKGITKVDPAARMCCYYAVLNLRTIRTPRVRRNTAER